MKEKLAFGILTCITLFLFSSCQRLPDESEYITNKYITTVIEADDELLIITTTSVITTEQTEQTEPQQTTDITETVQTEPQQTTDITETVQTSVTKTTSAEITTKATSAAETTKSTVIITTAETPKSQTTTETAQTVTETSETTVSDIEELEETEKITGSSEFEEETDKGSSVAPIKVPPLTSLSSQADLKLREDFAVYMSDTWQGIQADDVYVWKYCGTYDGCEAVIMYRKDYDMTDVDKEINFAGYTIFLPSTSLSLMLHKDGSFIEISKAYSSGYLDEKDVYKLQYYANNW